MNKYTSGIKHNIKIHHVKREITTNTKEKRKRKNTPCAPEYYLCDTEGIAQAWDNEVFLNKSYWDTWIGIKAKNIKIISFFNFLN